LNRRRLGFIVALAFSGAATLTMSPTALADCNSSAGSTLCTSSGTVSGSDGAPTSIPTFNPYPCYGTPTCDYYDDYDPGLIWDLPNFGGGGSGGGGIGGGGIGPR